MMRMDRGKKIDNWRKERRRKEGGSKEERKKE